MSDRPGPLWPLMLPSDHREDDGLCAVSAQGVRVRFADGSERLCGTSGLWNCILGYGNHAIAQAAADALRDASYLSVWGYENSYARRAAAALVDLAGPHHFGRVLFSTSGGSANDLVMKLARHYQALRGEHRRKGVIGLEGGYHGLTFGAFALTTARLGQQMYGVDRRMVAHVPPNDPEKLDALLTKHTGQIAAVVVEPVIGTAAVPLTESYVAELLRLRGEHGFLLVADEVSTGFARIGPMFATHDWPEPPDIMITAKGLTNGTSAASAVIVSRAVADTFSEAGAVLAHAETQAGTPIVGASIMAMIEEMRRLDAMALSRRLSVRLDEGLSRLVDQEPLVSATTGKGCLRSLRLRGPDGEPLSPTEVPAVVAAIREAGALVHPGPSCVQLLPALVYGDDDLDELLERVSAGLAEYKRTAA
ncbi:aminotransferase class III-fold pyridoxal phosphate-dependent enzyme [Streptosporangium sp. NBC_01639]|uniref:daptide-type RiPP biosynthesis aminotransferase n=1 Tax=Streptosporangium sp. NBC_01639 TaxID=2975948 RepID=UPI0038645839|nr:aminotransferase class III-fold pyridoxal phosphate-dependent enzyme [Streptosporangium sp. NBC_01639]